jgi:hypothetical protein
MAKVGCTQGPVKRTAKRPYRDLTLVPLAEKAKACRSNSVKGIRQISSVTSGEGVPAVKTAGRSDQGALTV